MDRRQIAVSICAASATSGVACLLASLQPPLAKYQTLLTALGDAVLLGAAVGLLVLLITAPRKGDPSAAGAFVQRTPFLNDEQKNFLLITLTLGGLFLALLWSTAYMGAYFHPSSH